MKARHWSLAIALILINWLIFATLFTQLMETDFTLSYATRVPVPTFTPAPAQPFVVVPTLTPAPLVPTPTATRVVAPGNEAAAPADTNAPANSSADAGSGGSGPTLMAPGAVNIRSGPGVNYKVIGTLNANTAVPVIGRNADSSWWQVKITSESGWVSSSVVNANNTGGIPVAEAPAAPPAAPPAQPAANNPPPKPKYQFEPTGWYDATNEGLTRFYGDIVDVNGNPVNGVFVQATCGDFGTISNPSGPVGWGPYAESNTWPDGFYDLTVDTRPVPCIWTLSVVETEDRETVKAVLSESIPVEVTMNKSIIVAGWRKNW